jgi:putative membrane protein
MELKVVLPHIIAAINLCTIGALLAGYIAIRKGDRATHKKCMVAALIFGALFLSAYLTYHFGAGLAKFGGHGIIRPIYFTILIIHIIAAIASTPLVPLIVYRALTGQQEAHRRLAPLTWKIWMFVAVSGIVVYVMTIHIWPYQGGA